MTTRQRVAIDGRALQEYPLSGVGRGLEGILPGLAEQVDLDLLTRRRGLRVEDPHITEHALRAPTRHWSIWLETAVPRFLAGYDGVFHCPWYGLPRRQPVPMVVTIHDISFERHPEWFSRFHRFAYRSQAKHAARTARVVLAPSAFAAREVQEFYGRSPDDVLVAPHGVSPRFRPRTDDENAETGRRLGLPAEYIVALGGRERRRPEVALEVGRRLAGSNFGIPLVMLDAPDGAPEPGVIRLSRLTDEDFAIVLGGAALFVYPTSYEGFGLPALEAAASGTPVVASRLASLPEVLGDAAAWAADTSVDALAAAALEVLGDRDAHAELVAAGLARAAEQQGWDRSVAAHLEAYRRTAGR